MAIEGTLDLFPLPDILQLISQQGKTGILTVQGEHDILAISFDRGRVVAADALNQTLEEALGEVLAGHGLVAPSDFAAVSAQHRGGRGRLIDLLVDGGYIDRDQMLGALRLHVNRLVTELLGWRQGEFKFYSGDEVTQEEGFQPISVEELLIRSVEEAAGDGHPTIPDSRSLYQPAPLGGRTLRVRREGDNVGSPSPGEVWLTEADQRVLEHLEEGAVVSELGLATGFDEYKVRYILHRLLEMGLARRRPAPIELPPKLDLGVSPAPTAPEAPVRPAAPVARAWNRPPTRPRTDTVLPVWGGRLLAIVAVGFIAALAVERSWQILTPFPWQQPARQALAKDLAFASIRRLDHAAKTHHLLSGGFPAELGKLAGRGLLSPREVKDPFGEPWAWTAAEGAYEVAGAGVSINEAVSENYLLDREFATRTEAEQAPLVLLD